MTLVSPLVMVLGAVGFTLVLTLSNYFAPVRKIWPSLLGCAMCSGFWIGISAYYWNTMDLPPTLGFVEQVKEFSRSVFHGGLVSAVSYVSYCIAHLAGKP